MTTTSVKKFTSDIIENYPSVATIKCYFFRAKSKTYRGSGWDNRQQTTIVIKPVKILGISSDAKPLRIDESPLISFTSSRTRRLIYAHSINCLEIAAHLETTKDGIEYFPSKVVIYSAEKNFMNALAEKYKDEPGVEDSSTESSVSQPDVEELMEFV